MKSMGLRVALLLCTYLLPALTQTSTTGSAALNRQTIHTILGFEGAPNGTLPAGWTGTPAGTISVDDQVTHTGNHSARLKRSSDAPGQFSSLTTSIVLDVQGDEIELRGFLRLRDVTGFAGLWLREDADGASVAFANMEKDQLRGTRDWAEYSLRLPLHHEATRLYLGVLEVGAGTVWADDLQVLVDGKPIAEVPQATVRPPSILDTDHTFDHGSHITIDRLTPLQIDNLVTLARVWGLLKYHHPQITSGHRQWDYDLLRILPAILAERDRDTANAALLRWVDDLGAVPDCTSCIHLDRTAVMMPDLAWLSDTATLGTPLSERLLHIYDNRNGSQFYVSKAKGVGNPAFDHELSYGGVTFPDAGFQLLALFRFWNVMQYWGPYRQVANEDWQAVLRAFIPQVALATDKDSYQLAMMRLIARAHDTHANLWSSLELRPPAGPCAIPVNVRFIPKSPGQQSQNDVQAVVTRYSTSTAASSSQLEPGDILEALGGKSVASLLQQWTPFYADSNEAARLRDISASMTQGACGPVSVRIRRGSTSLQVESARVPRKDLAIPRTHDLPGDTFRLLSKDVAYLKLSTVRADDIRGYIERAQGTRGLIVDIRNYPSDFVVFTLGSLLATQPKMFARFTEMDIGNPGAFSFAASAALEPALPHYGGGKVVILVDELSQSQSEYTAMALRSTPNAIIVGSTTAGADGNVSPIPLPGALSTAISGLGVFYPDGAPTQRVGIRPDIEAYPSLEGIRGGRDEILETAIRQIIGSNVPSAEIQRLAHP